MAHWSTRRCVRVFIASLATAAACALFLLHFPQLYMWVGLSPSQCQLDHSLSVHINASIALDVRAKSLAESQSFHALSAGDGSDFESDDDATTLTDAASQAGGHVAWAALSSVVDTTALARCRPTAHNATRLHGTACRDPSALSFAVVRHGLSIDDDARYEAIVTASLTAEGGAPLSGLLLTASLVCEGCASMASGSAPHRVEVQSFSHDLCNGSYAFRFEGVDTSPSLAWTLLLRVEFANFEHFLTTGPLCTRVLPGVFPAIPDGADGTRGCGLIHGAARNVVGPFLLSDVPRVSRGGSSRRDEGAGDKTEGSSELHVLAEGERAIDAMPVCEAGSAFDNSGRWLVRPRNATIDPSLCRAGAEREGATDMWTTEDDYVWCPRTCRLRMYSRADVGRCFAGKGYRRVLFVGDSRTHNLYFDIGTRALHGHKPLPTPEAYKCPLPPPCGSFSAFNATVDVIYTWGLFDQRAPGCAPPSCEHEPLNHEGYYYHRERDGFAGGLGRLKQALWEGEGYDVLVFSEGIHVVQPYFVDDDYEILVRSVLDIAALSPHPPRAVVFHTIPAVVDFGSATREMTRIATLSERAVRAVREMLPSALVLDVLAMSSLRRDRYFDKTHFFPSEPKRQDTTAHPLTLGSEVNLALLNMLCNDAVD